MSTKLQTFHLEFESRHVRNIFVYSIRLSEQKFLNLKNLEVYYEIRNLGSPFCPWFDRKLSFTHHVHSSFKF